VAAAVRAGHPVVIPVLPVVDTIKEVAASALSSSDAGAAGIPSPAANLSSPEACAAGTPSPAANLSSPEADAAGAASPASGSSSPGAGAGSAIGPGTELVLGTVDRSVLRVVQTPQGFRRDVLVAAHAAAKDALTDDAGLAEKQGVPVVCVPGSELALKITRPLDLILAEALLHAS